MQGYFLQQLSLRLFISPSRTPTNNSLHSITWNPQTPPSVIQCTRKQTATEVWNNASDHELFPHSRDTFRLRLHNSAQLVNTYRSRWQVMRVAWLCKWRCESEQEGCRYRGKLTAMSQYFAGSDPGRDRCANTREQHDYSTAQQPSPVAVKGQGRQEVEFVLPSKWRARLILLRCGREVEVLGCVWRRTLRGYSTRFAFSSFFLFLFLFLCASVTGARQAHTCCVDIETVASFQLLSQS